VADSVRSSAVKFAPTVRTVRRSAPIESERTNPVPPSPAAPEPSPAEACPARYSRRRILEEPDPEFVPHMLAQLEDELARSRKREAFWISVVVHICVVLLIVFSPELLPKWAQPHLLRANDKNNHIYLALPPDTQKPPARVQSNKLSDKNRIAQSRIPRLDRRTLKELRSLGNGRPPGQPAMPPAPPPMPEEATVRPPPARPAPPPPVNLHKPEMAMRQPKLQPAPKPEERSAGNPFKVPGSAGAIIADALHGTRPAFPRGGAGGLGSGYGIGPVAQNARFGPVDILSDTQGVDFGPYLSRVLEVIKVNWYNLVPEEARPPLMKHGRVAIRFLITPSGKVAGLEVEKPSGDKPLDRAAYGGITASDPFSPLPHEFHGPYLALRITFIYNPTPAEMEQLSQ
jgi:TonB family protein